MGVVAADEQRRDGQGAAGEVAEECEVAAASDGGFDPVAGAPGGAVGGVGAFGDDAFDVPPDTSSSTFYIWTATTSPPSHGAARRAILEQLLPARTPLLQRAGPVEREAALESLEVGAALGVEGDDFAVEDGAVAVELGGQGGGDFGEAGGEGVAGRDCSSTCPWCTRAIPRAPSCLISATQPSPLGGGPAVGSIGPAGSGGAGRI